MSRASEQPPNDGSPDQSMLAEEANNYAFLVHSHKTLTENLPPKIDNKALTRPKRRRTSPHDHAILEAEYRQNPKPDKARRADIVKQVSMGEKEVQIWFQNRRQNDRRKSKPLQHEEPACSWDSSSPAEKVNQTANSTKDVSQLSPIQQVTALSPLTPLNNSFKSTVPLQEKATEEAPEQPIKEPPKDTPQASKEPLEARRDIRLTTPPPTIHSRKRSREDLESEALGPPSLRLSLSYDGEAILRAEGEKTPSPPRPRDPVRISMSADGEALIRTASEPSPTKQKPTRPRPIAPVGMRRSISSVSFLGSSDKPFGRSRNSRAWGLHCDTDARSALSLSQGPKQARHRSDVFSRQALTPRNYLPNTGERGEKRKKLSRTVSSYARLESGKTKSEIEFHSGDSDKENWAPGTALAGNRPARRHNRHQGHVVHNSRPRTQSSKSRGMLLYEDDESNSISQSLPGSEETGQSDDLDCIQGLLSLSQGAWQ